MWRLLFSDYGVRDAIVVGAGAGLSTAAGLTYSGERFEKYFLSIALQVEGLRNDNHEGWCSMTVHYSFRVL